MGTIAQSGANSFTLTPQKWIEATNAIGIISKSGRYGGTFAYRDIAFEFATWISAEFKFYLINEFQRLKENESNRTQLEWNFQRTLAKVNYHIHTDAIRENLIPEELSKKQVSFIYANEADVLNMALFALVMMEQPVSGELLAFETVRPCITWAKSPEAPVYGVDDAPRLKTRFYSNKIKMVVPRSGILFTSSLPNDNYSDPPVFLDSTLGTIEDMPKPFKRHSAPVLADTLLLRE